jgi:putative transposase
MAAALREIYQAPTMDVAERQLDEFAGQWGQRYPVIVKSWRANWARVVPMISYLREVRRAIYTTNTIESLNMTLRKISKNRGCSNCSTWRCATSPRSGRCRSRSGAAR